MHVVCLCRTFLQLFLSTCSQLREDDDDDNNNENKSFEKKLEDYKEGEKIFCFVKTVRSKVLNRFVCLN